MQVFEETLLSDYGNCGALIAQLNRLLDFATKAAVNPIAAAHFANYEEGGFFAGRTFDFASPSNNCLFNLPARAASKATCQTERFTAEINTRRRIIKRKRSAGVTTGSADARRASQLHEQIKQFQLFLVVQHPIFQHCSYARVKHIRRPTVGDRLIGLQPLQEELRLRLIDLAISHHSLTQAQHLINLAIGDAGSCKVWIHGLTIAIKRYGTTREHGHNTSPLRAKDKEKVIISAEKINNALTKGKCRRHNLSVAAKSAAGFDSPKQLESTPHLPSSSAVFLCSVHGKPVYGRAVREAFAPAGPVAGLSTRTVPSTLIDSRVTVQKTVNWSIRYA